MGLPLAVQIAKIKKSLICDTSLERKVYGLDIDSQRLEELSHQIDKTNEIDDHDLCYLDEICFTSNEKDIATCEVFIVTVPTPIDSAKKPDLTPLINATKTIANVINSSNATSNRVTPVIIYESTVYPGVTEDVCIPILEKLTECKLNIDFACGYSPERVNPGDRNNSIANIKKVTSGSSDDVGHWIDRFYASFISAGTHLAPTIKVAEASKVIENTQRDLNIALINEIAIILSKMGIDTQDTLDAASTKWNFMKFSPGLVGGHCIGVDPYYLTFKSEQLHYHPAVVTSGRRINDSMADWVANQMIVYMAKNKISISESSILILGITFKENCPDTRNTQVLRLIQTLSEFTSNIDVVDPFAFNSNILDGSGLLIAETIPKNKKYDAVLLSVAHNQFCEISQADWNFLKKSPRSLLYDLKGIIPRSLDPVRL